VGPPGLSINETIQKALSKGDQQFELFNCGEEIGRVQTKFGEEEQRRFKSCLLLAEESINPIIGKLEALCRADRNYIIEGFPKNLKQAHLLQ
jgi:adenylate kinase family enzyme